MSVYNAGMVREFPFTEKDFNFLRQLVIEKTGINLKSTKQEMVYSRLVKRLRYHKLDSFEKYCELLQSDAEGKEIVFFTNALTTNLTSFFREPHHFWFLQSSYFPEVKRLDQRRLRIWSAGCSTGEEAYSAAIAVKNYFRFGHGLLDARIIATDIDSSVLDYAKKGIYDLKSLNKVDEENRRKWFRTGPGILEGKAQVRDELRQLITFKQLNLMDEWPMHGQFNAVFCRNVLIYFDKPTQKELVERFANIISDQGYLFIGHSESLFKVSERFRCVGQTIYQKIA